MISASKVTATVRAYLQQSDTLPSAQLRRLGVVYSSYRLILSLFLMLMVYITAKVDSSFILPSLLQQTALSFYVLLSLVLFGLFIVVPDQPQRQLAFGLAVDVIVLSLLLYTNGAPDLQLTMLYMVVVAASFMLLAGGQALVITLLAIIFIIYQQFFYAIANSINLVSLGDALLISASFLAIGFLSWSVSQRLLYVEKMTIQQAQEVDRLNTINQEVISQMINGMIVVDKERIVLANLAAYQLLGIGQPVASDAVTHDDNKRYNNSNPTFISKTKGLAAKSRKNRQKRKTHYDDNPLIAFQKQLIDQHSSLIESYLALVSQSRTFIYELPATSASTANKLRIQIIPLKENSQLVLLEDLRREQAGAQQLKLASLGQLTASIAHEIRNPLAAISQASQLLMEDIDEGSNDRLSGSQATIDTTGNHELYKMIFAQTKRVNRIIEDVLKLSRQQQANQQTIDISDWLSQFLDNYFRDQDVTLRIYTELSVQFDTHQLEQILINLINNGLRYSKYACNHASVEVEVYRVQNDVIIDVLDNGSGVDGTDLEHLFEPFFTTDKKGTGLGLYLSQAFSEANHAQLLYANEREKTCFRLQIPMATLVDEV